MGQNVYYESVSNEFESCWSYHNFYLNLKKKKYSTNFLGQVSYCLIKKFKTGESVLIIMYFYTQTPYTSTCITLRTIEHQRRMKVYYKNTYERKQKKSPLKNLMARLCEVFYTKQQIAWGITFLTRPPVSQSDSPAFGKLNPQIAARNSVNLCRYSGYNVQTYIPGLPGNLGSIIFLGIWTFYNLEFWP